MKSCLNAVLTDIVTHYISLKDMQKYIIRLRATCSNNCDLVEDRVTIPGGNSAIP